MVTKDFKTRVLPISNKLHRFCTHFLKDEEIAKDVVQDLFLKLWQKREGLSEIENIEAFAMRMARNKCVDVIRANKTTSIEGETSRRLEEESIDVHSKFELSESAQRIKNLIKKLPDVQRLVMQLRDLEHYSYEEIAEASGLKVNAIRVNLSRARKKVRDEFIKLDNNESRQGKTITATLF